jgi:hypothetical protein
MKGYVIQEVFPGCPKMKKGYMFPGGTGFRFPIRKPDGTQIRP